MKSSISRNLRIYVCCLLVAVMVTGCSHSDFSGFFGNFLDDTKPIETDEISTDDDNNQETTESDKTSFFVDIDPENYPTITSENNGGDTTESDEKLQLILNDQLRLQIRNCITESTDLFQNEINLTDCLAQYEIMENHVDDLISVIVQEFEHVYMQNPDLFYLDGSLKAGYELQSAWGGRKLTAMIIELRRYGRFEQASYEDLAGIRKQMHEEAASLAELVGENRSEWEKLLIVHDELVRRIVYDDSLNQENNQAASALLEGMSLCKGYAQAFKLISDQLDVSCQVISGQAGGIEHAWNLVTLEGKVYHVDVTHDDPVPDRGNMAPVDHRHFLRSDSIMANSHIWDNSLYISADEDGAHYFRQNDLTVSDRQELQQKLEQYFVLNNFDDDRADQLELLYEGNDSVSENDFDMMFREALNKSNLNRKISYNLSTEKSIMQLTVMPE